MTQQLRYLCTNCGSILKETTEYIDIHSLREECPDCGSLLAESLERRSMNPPMPRSLHPELQTADSLLKLRFDLPKIDSFLGLGATDLCCISGYKANLILTRLCVKALLPSRHGGLDTKYAMVADAGNRTDVYQAVKYGRQYGLLVNDVMDRILVSRTFTIYQLRRLLTIELPKIIDKYQLRIVAIPGLLDMFEDPNIRVKEATKEIEKLLKMVNKLSSKVLVITSIQCTKYSELIVPHMMKHINLSQDKHQNGIIAEIYNQGERRTVAIKERELMLIPKK